MSAIITISATKSIPPLAKHADTLPSTERLFAGNPLTKGIKRAGHRPLRRWRLISLTYSIVKYGPSAGPYLSTRSIPLPEAKVYTYQVEFRISSRTGSTRASAACRRY